MILIAKDVMRVANLMAPVFKYFLLAKNTRVVPLGAWGNYRLYFTGFTARRVLSI